MANALNGVDLRAMTVGDVVELPEGIAEMLVGEGWAEELAADSASSADDRRTGSDRRLPKRR